MDFEPSREMVISFIEPFWPCVVCKHKNKCPSSWECEFIENLRYDYSNYGVDKA